MTWWTRRHAELVLCSAHSWICSLHVKRPCGSFSRVVQIGGAAEAPLPHAHPLSRCLRDVEASSFSPERMRIPSKEGCIWRDTVRRETAV